MYIRRMIKQILCAALLAAAPAPAFAQAANFEIVNGTGAPISGVSIRRTTTQSWRPLSVSAGPGARTSVTFTDPDCAFDIQANLTGIGLVVWTGVNLCGTKVVILNRNGSGVLWVDYD